MKLRTQTAIAIVVIGFIILLLLHFVSVFIVMPGFKNVDDQDSKQSLAQARSTIDYRLAQLERTLRDYAWWDDTYNFAQNLNPEYLESNFAESTFQNLDLNLIAIRDSNNDVVYCQSYSLNSSRLIDTSDQIKQWIASNWAFSSESDTISGFALLDDQPMMIAITQILTSSNQGPAIGKMFFGTYLDYQEITALKEINNIDFSVSTIADFKQENNEIAQSLLSNQAIIVKEKNDTHISGYLLLNDINDNPLFVLQTYRERSAYQQGLWVEALFLACSIIIVVSSGLVILAGLEWRIIRPMNKLAASVKDIPFKSTISKKVSKFDSHEVTVLSGAVKDTLDEKMASMLEVSMMVAHDLRNPLAGIKNANYVLKKNYREILDAKGNQMLTIIDDCVEYSDKIVKDLLDYSTQITLDKVLTPLKGLVNSSLQTFVLPQNIEIRTNIKDELSIFVDPEKIQRVFTNLIKNAFDAMPNGGKLEVSSNKTGHGIVVEFTDNGIGMSEETLKKLWVPFFTTKARGLGIGLPICKRIIEAHDGKLDVKSTLNKGTTFAVYFPMNSKN